MESNAQFSPCRRYRYTLRREWIGGEGTVNFIGLNPSTADETHDDPTIRRCVGFSKLWGFQALVMLNLFAWRATDRTELRRVADPIGPDNDAMLREHVLPDRLTVAAWGTDGVLLGRATAVRAMLFDLHCLRLTKGGHPEHPLYLPGDLKPVPFGPPTPPFSFNDHAFVQARTVGLNRDWIVCANCGVIYPSGSGKQCRGRVRVALRDE